jgi:exopolyphosphatase/guanosine-5'-triphosphate,3'-diphosphate pyrophosphatase
MRKAVIDLGTNTFNLLIVQVNEGEIQVLHNEKEGVALGMGGINNQMISPKALDRALNALKRFKRVCENHEVSLIKAIGTSAIRDAKNAADFLKIVKVNVGIDIEIVSGQREAELIYKGIAASHNFEDHSLIMDIGGGSTEFISANQLGIHDMISMNIGVSRIFQLFDLSDPLTITDVFHIEKWLDTHAGTFFKNRKEKVLIGASGSFETFYELIHNEQFPEKNKSIEISIDHLTEILEQIISSTQEERDLNEWIIPIRKKMAPIAAVKTRWVLKQIPATKIFISPYSLKEGVVFE